MPTILINRKYHFGVRSVNCFENIISGVRSVNFFENIILGVRSVNFQFWGCMQIFVFFSKSCFWMFDWWFQTLGGSEPTPDGLALTFEFVRSKKGWFCDENVTLSPKVISVNFFENIICWVRSVILFVRSLVKSPSGGKNPWKTTPANPRRALFEKCFNSWFDTVRLWGMSCAFAFLRNYWFRCILRRVMAETSFV